MIKSETYRGLIYAGATALASNLVVAQTGPMQLTVAAGQLTDTGGTVHDVPATVLNVVAGNDPKKPYAVTVAGIWVVMPFSVPAGTTDLSQIDIYVLSVQPGFPAGVAATGMQSGIVKARA